MDYVDPPKSQPEVRSQIDSSEQLTTMVLQLQAELKAMRSAQIPPRVESPQPPKPPQVAPRALLTKNDPDYEATLYSSPWFFPPYVLFAKRAAVVVLVIAIASLYFGPKFVDRWIKPSHFNITSDFSAARQQAYNFISEFDKKTEDVFSARLRAMNKGPEIYQIKTPQEMLEIFEKNPAILFKMKQLLKMYKAYSVSSYHVINEYAPVDRVPDFIILDNMYEAPEKWYQYLAVWARDVTKMELAKTLVDWFGFEKKHTNKLTILFSPKIVAVGESKRVIDQKVGDLYEAMPKPYHTFHDLIFVDGFVLFAVDDSSLVKLESCKSVPYSGKHAWAIQNHIETTAVLMNLTKSAN